MFYKKHKKNETQTFWDAESKSFYKLIIILKDVYKLKMRNLDSRDTEKLSHVSFELLVFWLASYFESPGD